MIRNSVMSYSTTKKKTRCETYDNDIQECLLLLSAKISIINKKKDTFSTNY